MLAKQPLGQGAASKKYDVLTALGAHACSGSKHSQRVVLRFITLITARYNWQRDELSIGRAELARLWQVDERTVKRDLAKLKDNGWLAVKRPSARGRVAVYAIDWAAVLEATRPAWPQVGADFAERVAAMLGRPEVEPTKVVAFPTAPAGETEWARACATLHRSDPAFYASWLAPVIRAGRAEGVLELLAPSAFHAQYLTTHALGRLTRAVREADPSIDKIVVRAK
jgi:hypothetical protein